MGSFHAEKITVRVLPEITIIFEKPRSIIVVPTTPPARLPVQFCIPFLHRGDYCQVWRHFRRQLWRQKTLTLGQCIRLAGRSDRIMTRTLSTLSQLESGQKLVEVKHDGWSIIGEGGRFTI